ncbi:multicopper oxidase family protein [Methylobacterium goesingense]|uniref:FtsP/CotA-like multicopper oxidase with cupredoxin domain n=1 Tax=Methylobacterium goesingense TaxID=243690 RepID=A0ABV2L6D8_9HYPH|nr:multicopper oxidase family protein [Methylobacterium goesingense]GJD72543.1 Multicopper oxidase MmcO [Methylobacterium goesingense]
MPKPRSPAPHASISVPRRVLLGGAAALSLAPRGTMAQAGKPQGSAAPGEKAPAAGPERILRVAPGSTRLKPEPAAATPVWTFDGTSPPPVVRIKLGETVRLKVENRTDKPLSLHWHGVRNQNPMDGVGGITQAPIAPGADFSYAFVPPDAGTFLIRPLVVGGSSEPSGRGLAGALIVEETLPPAADQDLTLLMQDWRIEEDASLLPFGQTTFAATSGRLGSLVTLNGAPVPATITGRPGSRVRLRLGNVCNARGTRIRFDGVKVYVLAVDGQPTDTFEPLRATLPFPPGTRYDLMLDLPTEAGASGSVTALVGNGLVLATLAVAGQPVIPARPAITKIGENALLPAEVKLQNAVRRDITITGGARIDKDKPTTEPVYTGDPNRIWAVNGASGSTGLTPLFSVKRGQVVVLAIKNATAFPQALHLHGHVFRLLHPLDDGWEPYWLDTFQLLEGRTARIAFKADNPGRWLISSTVLERFDTGLWTLFEVT